MSHYSPVKCAIERGGFSSERTFEVVMPDGSKLMGTADLEYLQDLNGNPLCNDEPLPGERLTGFVTCRVIRRVGEEMLVEFPSTDVVRINESQFEEMAC